MPIREYLVTEPPTSAEVQERIIDALRLGSPVELVILSTQRVPRPSEMAVSFHIRQTVHPPEGGMVVSGTTENNSTLTVRTGQELAEPARASYITR